MADKPRNKRRRKPRLWVPGAAYVDDERILRLGADIGFNGWGEDFRIAQCHFTSLADLRHRVWLIERSALNDELVDEHAIILPHTLVDADEQPHARRWLDKQPLTCISGVKLGPLIDKGLRVYCVEHGVEGEGLMRIQAAGGKRPSWSLRLDVAWLQQQIIEQLGVPEAVGLETLDVRTAIDRILRQRSRGVLSEVAVLNALTARRLVEPGYGYRGATDGRAASVEQIALSLSGIEALFAQIDERAGEQRLIARDMADALRGINEEEQDVTVPLYGVARRQQLQELTLPLQDDPQQAPSWVMGSEPRARLQLPAHAHLLVSDVKLWSPKLPPAIREQLQAERPLRQPPPAWLTPLLLLALLLIIGAALLQLL